MVAPGIRGQVVDLFCGAGGFSLGAALSGFDVTASVDVDPILTSSYGTNFRTDRLLLADLGAVEPADVARFAKLDGRPDVVVGGPPCQGFSTIGSRQAGDARNRLLFHFFRHVAGLRPRYFVMENVPGLLEFGGRAILEEGLAELPDSYEVVGPFVVDAADFGAATRRRRVLVLGYDRNEAAPLSEGGLRTFGLTHPTTVKDAIADLPEPRPDVPGGDLGWWRYDGRHTRLSPYARKMRSAPPEGLGSPEALAQLGLGFVSGLHSTAHTQAVVKRFARVNPGSEDAISRYPRLSWSGQSRTLRAGTGSERGSFQSMRPIHPSKARVITVREGARLQGFPDWFLFHPTKWHSFRMIGNSVSPVLSQALFSYLADRLGQVRNAEPTLSLARPTIPTIPQAA